MPSLMEKIEAFYQALHAGKALADPSAAANRATAATLILVLVQAVDLALRSFGIDLQIGSVDQHTIANALAIVLAAVVDRVHTAANPHAGR